MGKNNLEYLRHSTSHLLAAAVMELWPKAKRTIGPSIEDGFYFDFDFGDTKISEEDLAKIENKMHGHFHCGSVLVQPAWLANSNANHGISTINFTAG